MDAPKTTEPAEQKCGCSRACSETAKIGAVGEPDPSSVRGAGMQSTALFVAGVDCPNEIAAIERAVKPIGGVEAVRVNLVSGRTVVSHDRRVSAEALMKAIRGAGFAVRLEAGGHVPGQRKQRFAVALSGAGTLLGLLCQWQHVADPFPLGLFVIGIVAGFAVVFPKTIAALRQRRLDMNVLMTVAVLGAVGLQQWAEGAMVIWLFAVSELLESLSVARARHALEALVRLSPQTAWRKTGETVQEVPVEQVRLGDTIAVRAGARVPLDGEVLTGGSAVNEAPITGEALPVEKTAGDLVFAGTINGPGALEVRVTHGYGDTTLARIIHLVEEAQEQKAPLQRFVDTFARYYTPAVIGIALAVFVGPSLWTGDWAVWFYRALVLLVIACPCALVIATPVSIISGLTAMARRGVLIKGGGALEALGRLRVLAFDKTGTITTGRLSVAAVVPADGVEEDHLLRAAAALDIHSDHPLARALVSAVRERAVSFPRSTNYRARGGRGAEGEIDGRRFFVGNERLAEEMRIGAGEIKRLAAGRGGEQRSMVVVGAGPEEDRNGRLIGLIFFSDTIRPEASRAVRELHHAGVRRLLMLSGDKQNVVDTVARQAGMDEGQGGLLPEEKIARIRELQERHRWVGMVGDGINDAPALAAATVGIAMGAAGTDAAIETADVALMRDDLSQVAEAICLGRRTLRVIQFNIAFAILVKAVVLVLAVMGYARLWLAICADTGATLLVIGNALRLLRSSGFSGGERATGSEESP